MNILLWAIQRLLAVWFGLTGALHFAVPPGLPPPMAWMYELPGGLLALSGTAEILAALGLIQTHRPVVCRGGLATFPGGLRILG